MTLQDFIAMLGLNSRVFLFLATIGLATCIIIEQMQLLVKFNGVQRKKIASGYNAAMKIMVLNRIGTVLYFLCIALSIDIGATVAQLNIHFIGAFGIIALYNLAVLVQLRHKLNLSIISALRTELLKIPVFAAAIATLFGLFGLTLPMLLSVQNPALRLTMANTGFLFNAIFTIFTVFFVESYLAKLIDNKDAHTRMQDFIVSVFVVRLASVLFGIGLMSLLQRYSEYLAF